MISLLICRNPSGRPSTKKEKTNFKNVSVTYFCNYYTALYLIRKVHLNRLQDIRSDAPSVKQNTNIIHLWDSTLFTDGFVCGLMSSRDSNKS